MLLLTLFCDYFFFSLLMYFSYVGVVVVFFFKQKTAYEMRISDWSSDVCSSDLRRSRQASASATCPASSATPARHCCASARRSRNSAQIGRASCRERVCQYV